MQGAGGAVVTLGTFDGVHRGHQAVLAEVLRRTGASGRTSVLVTFDPHPLAVVNPAKYDEIGIVPVEAMAFGTPLVTSSLPIIDEAVGNAALFCNPDSAEDIAEKIIRLLEEEELWNTLSANGRSRAAELFSVDRRTQELDSVIKFAASLRRSNRKVAPAPAA